MFLFATIGLFLSVSGLILIIASVLYDTANDSITSSPLKNISIILLAGLVIFLEVILARTLIINYKENQGYEVISSVTKLERVRILNMTKPKHVYIDLVNLVTGVQSNRIYISKHCNNQDMSDIGSEMQMEVTYFEYKNGKSSIRYNTSHICG